MQKYLSAVKQILPHGDSDIMKIFLGAIISLSQLVSAASIPDRISFQHILENKDIAMGEGAAFFQDSEGYMWLGGGNALIRYDGYEFRQFDYSVNDANPNEKQHVRVVQDIMEDSRHTLWVGTRAGLLQFDSTQEKLMLVKDDKTQEIKITTSNITKLIELPSGEILACTTAGLLVINPQTLTYSAIVADKSRPSWLQSTRINTAYLDHSGDIWLGTDNGLDKLNWQTKNFSHYKITNEKTNVASANRVMDIISDNNGKFWVATTNGLAHFDPNTLQTVRHVNDPSDRFSLGGNEISKLLLDSQGILWIATDGGGLSVYDKENNRFVNYQAEAGNASALNTNKIRTVYEDRNGDIWVGNFPVGIHFFDRSTASIVTYISNSTNPNSLSNTSVLSASEDSKGNLWLGTDGGGLNFFDREKSEFTHFTHDPANPATISANSVLTTLVDSNGLIWVGTWGGGLASYNPSTQTFTRYPFEASNNSEKTGESNTLNSQTVWSIKEDKEHNLWIGTHSGGLNKFNPETKTFTHYTHITNEPNSLSAPLVWCSLEDSNGNLWVGTELGLDLMNRDKGTFTHFVADPNDPTSLSNSKILSIFEDSKQRLWLGTDSGLNLLDTKTKKFTRFNKKNGFVDDTIRDVLEDTDGIIWVSTNNGFSSLNPETKKIKNYNRIGGRLVGAFATHSGTLTKKGEVVFGGVEGLRIFNPRELSDNKTVPPVVLTDFKIFSDSIFVGGKDGVLNNVINHSKSVQLDYKKSMFTIDFSALNFRDSSKNIYAYKLEGFDNQWINVGNQRSAKYTNLNAGKYTFTVKASNNDGVWNETGKTITIIQLPPPWKTWWAYTLYFLFAIMLLAWFIHTQRRKRKIVEEQNRILEIKVAERTAEVIQKSNDIQAMLTNIPQGLFTIDANGAIHPEYSQYLESIFETNVIAGKKAMELLFHNANLGSDALDSAKAALATMIGENDINYELNNLLLITEYDVTINNKQKFLSLDWNPIIIDNIVHKMMVSVRDITQLREMELSALEQKRQLGIISQLLDLSSEKFLSFEESTKKYIDSNRESIEKSIERDNKIIALLFRNMHTIKGNCRTFGFSHLSNTVHEVESTYSALKASDDTEWNQKALLHDLDLVEKGVEEYANIYHNVLGRGKGTAKREKGFWMNDETMYNIQQFIHRGDLEGLKVYMSRLNAITIEKNLSDVISSLPSIAIQLDKKAPRVLIEPNNISIKLPAQQLMSNIFAHILRNCVDHGLETTAARIAAAKNEVGTIQIKTELNNGNLDILVNDDGRGLNISRLFQKGIQIGQWNEDDKPSTLDIAQLIFYSGVSTKEAVTDISGRGVGMDAVKQFLIEQGGNVSIKLLEDTVSDNGFIRFCLIVTLPSTLFFIEK